jgi:hypothetical protein
MVATSTTQAELDRRIAKLTAEHEQLFKCAVRPGFYIQLIDLNLPVFNAMVAGQAIPVIAGVMRNRAIAQAVANWHPSQRRRDDFNPTPDQVSLLEGLGFVSPLSSRLRSSFDNWLLLSAAPNNTAEFSADVYASRGISLAYSLKGVGISFNLSVVDRPTTLADRLGYVLLLSLSDNSTSATAVDPVYAPGSSVVILGPIAALFPADVFTRTNDSAAWFSSVLTPTSTSSPSPSATAPPPADQTALFYREAKIQFLVPTSLASQYSGLAIVDLLTDTILSTTITHTNAPSGDFQVLSASVSTTKGGIWGGGWSGGGMYAVAILGNDGTLLHSLSFAAGNKGVVTPAITGSMSNSLWGTTITSNSTSPTSSVSSTTSTTTSGDWTPGWWVSKAFWG